MGGGPNLFATVSHSRPTGGSLGSSLLAGATTAITASAIDSGKYVPSIASSSLRKGARYVHLWSEIALGRSRRARRGIVRVRHPRRADRCKRLQRRDRMAVLRE